MNRTEKLPRLPIANAPKREKKRSRGGCKNCKEKKKGCTKEKPTCARCRERDLECIYPPLQPRRRHQPAPIRGGSSSDPHGPSMHNVEEVTSDSERFSISRDTSQESSPSSVTPFLAASSIRSPQDVSYFRDTVATLLVVPGTANPLVDQVLPLADRNEVLLNALCLVSKVHQAQTNPSTASSSYLNLYQLVLRGLRSSVGDAHPSEPDYHLATNVALSYFEMIRSQSSKALRVYLGGAFSVLQLEGSMRTPTTASLEKILYFFDVLQSLSSGQAPLNNNPNLLNSFLPSPPLSASSEIDPIFGRSGTLWPVLHRLAGAIEVKHHIATDVAESTSRSRSAHSVQEALESLEKERAQITSLLQNWSLTTPLNGHPNILPGLESQLGLHAEAIRSAGLIHVSRELYDLPAHAAEVQTPTKTVIGACRKILNEGGPSLGLLWPLFTAALNLMDDAEIATARGIFLDLTAQRHMNNVSIAWKICEQIWNRRARGMRDVHWHQLSADLQESVVFG